VVTGLSSVTFVRPAHGIEIFGNVSTPFGTLAMSVWYKFYGDRPRGTPPSVGGGVKPKRGNQI